MPSKYQAGNRSKYGVRTDAAGKAARTVDGILFASLKEAQRYCLLKVLEKAGKIKWLQLQERLPIEVNGVKICTYVCDFTYFDSKNGMVREDVKGMRTPVYKLKKKLVEAIWETAITEV